MVIGLLIMSTFPMTHVLCVLQIALLPTARRGLPLCFQLRAIVTTFIFLDCLAHPAHCTIPQPLEELASAADTLMMALQLLSLLATCAFSATRCRQMQMILSAMMLP